jgi:hypothetical protein
MKNGRTFCLCIWILSIFILCSKTGFTQDSSVETTQPVFAQVSLLYDFPESYGITSGIQLPLRFIIKNITLKSGRTVTKQRDIVGGVNAGFYRYSYNYTGVILLPFIARRRYYHSTFFTEASLGMGVLRTFYDGKVYKVDAAGNVSEAKLFGRFYATTNLAWSFNWLLNKPGQSNIALQLKPSLWFQYPYNSFIKPHASLEAGIKYEITKRCVLVKTIHKSKRR